jgi:beta-mannanase
VTGLNLEAPYYNSEELRSYAKKVRKVGGAIQLTFVPDSTQEFIDFRTIDATAAFQKVVEDCRHINNQGVPVFLNFAPEMNANYFKYGMNPESYKKGYTDLANLVRGAQLTYTGR